MSEYAGQHRRVSGYYSFLADPERIWGGGGGGILGDGEGKPLTRSNEARKIAFFRPVLRMKAFGYRDPDRKLKDRNWRCVPLPFRTEMVSDFWSI